MASFSTNDAIFIERFLNAFKNLGGNELGFIDYKDFKSLLIKKIGKEEKSILDLVNEEQHVRDGKLDYMSLCFSILAIKTIFNSFSLENGKIPPTSPRINTHTFSRRKGSNNLDQTKNKETTSQELFSKRAKGLLFKRNKDLLGYRYKLELLENSNVEIYAKTVSDTSDDCRLPIEILVFQENKKKVFITCSSVINDNGCSVKFNFKKGIYILIPVLLKWNQSFNIPQDVSELMYTDEESNTCFTPLCKNALSKVFNAIDIDENGLLNQLEFDLFIRHISGETASEEWTTVEDNFKMKDEQLTFDGFLELYKLVLQTDPFDMLSMFQQIGMNENFELKNAHQFILTVISETAKFNLSPLPVLSYVELSAKVMKKIAIEQGCSSKVKDMNDLFLFKHYVPYRITYVIQNQSHSKVTVRLDCSGSINCESHRGSLDYTVEVLPRTSMIVHHLFPVDVTKDWNVECKESFKTII